MNTATEWSGTVGDAWAAEWRRTDRSFADLAPHLDAAIRMRAPATGVAVDIGCGAGATSLALAAARPDLRITGVDLSSTLVATARQRAGAAGAVNAVFVHGAVEQAAAAIAPVDLYASRHGVMFFADPVAALAALHAAARPGAWLVFSCFRSPAENLWASEVAAAVHGTPPPRASGYVPGPFGFADPCFVGATLRAAGWSPEPPVPVDFSYRAGAGRDPVADALDFFGRIGPAASALRTAPAAERVAMLGRLRALLDARERAGKVDLPAAAWLWSAQARRISA